MNVYCARIPVIGVSTKCIRVIPKNHLVLIYEKLLLKFVVVTKFNEQWKYKHPIT